MDLHGGTLLIAAKSRKLNVCGSGVIHLKLTDAAARRPYQKRLSDFPALASIRRMAEPVKSKKPLIVAVLLLILFAAAYIFVLSAYKNESNNRAAELTPDAAKVGENRIDVSGRIVTADPIKGEIMVRLEFT